MKRLVVILMVSVFALISTQALAQKVALIDMQRCVSESEAGKKVQSELRKMEMDRGAQIKVRQDELTKMQKEYLDQEKTLSEAGKKKRAEDIQAKMMDYEDTVRKFNAELQKKERDAIEKMEPELQAIITNVAKSDKIELVFFKQAVLYAPNAVDITQKVIDQYNKQQK